VQKAEELGIDLSEIEGSGSDGSITIRDVRSAAQQGWRVSTKGQT
jgi:pyruvate/2-oxoglutarate dehydrogenase complex dihydrolipoamide acyltransferase (E2) component